MQHSCNHKIIYHYIELACNVNNKLLHHECCTRYRRSTIQELLPILYIYYNKLIKTIIYNFLRLIRLRIGFRAGVLGVRVGVCCVGLYVGCIIYIYRARVWALVFGMQVRCCGLSKQISPHEDPSQMSPIYHNWVCYYWPGYLRNLKNPQPFDLRLDTQAFIYAIVLGSC